MLNKLIYKKLILFIVLFQFSFILIFLCFAEASKIQLKHGEHKEYFSIEYTSLGVQYDIIKDLVENNIPFHIDIDGVIKISKEYEEIYLLIINNQDSRPHTIIKERRLASLLTLLFEINNINYEIRKVCDDNIYFFWDEISDSEARRIINTEFVQSIKDSYKTKILGQFGAR
ncbi:MAG: hypothetical protein JKP90_10245 [Desulfofustis sp. PB-SRB1]|nr:hypothetical protein [Desulfofustis sp. PB-SRB1]